MQPTALERLQAIDLTEMSASEALEKVQAALVESKQGATLLESVRLAIFASSDTAFHALQARRTAPPNVRA